MKCIWVLILIFVHSSVSAFENKIVTTVQYIRSNGRITNECNDALALYLENLASSTEDQWALKMLDATSKIPVGLLFSYNFGELGEYNQCLETESQDGIIKGKYCLGTLSHSLTSAGPNFIKSNSTAFRQQVYLREMFGMMSYLQPRDYLEPRDGNVDVSSSGPSWAICLPSLCKDEDVAEILQNLIGSRKAVCQTKDDLSPPLTTGAIVVIVLLSEVAFLLVSSTICDLYFIYKDREPPSAILVSFSIYRNGRKLFKTTKNSAELSCLNGIKFLSMLWVIVGHVFSTHAGGLPVTNFKAILDWANSLKSMIIVSGTLSVDSFFLVGGALVVYSFMKAKHNGAKFNIFYFYLHRYLRLTPALVATLLVSSYLMVYMGSGPKWNAIESNFQQPCQKYWWSAVLYVQNYVNPLDICLGHTWYLSVDMQLYVLSPLILWPLWKYPKIGVTMVVSFILAFIAVPFYVGYNRELSAIVTNFYNKNLVNYIKDYYYPTHTRAAPWIIGVLVGYILAKIKFQRVKVPNIHKYIVFILWEICIILTLTCVFAGHSTLRGEDYDKWGNAFYIAMVRPVWSLCLAWVILACALGYGGPINTLLSFPVYQVFNRFTYSIYLLHLPLLTAIALASKRGVYFSFFNAAYSFWGIAMFSFGLSIPWVLAFESPIIIIEKLIFKGFNRINSWICGLFGQKTEEIL